MKIYFKMEIYTLLFQVNFYSKDASQKQSISYEGEKNFKSNDNNNNPIS